MTLALSERDGVVLVPVAVQPRARRTGADGLEASGALRVKLTAPPVDGAANEALLRWLGREVLGVAPSTLEVVRGAAARSKLVGVRGLALDEVARRIRAHLPPDSD